MSARTGSSPALRPALASLIDYAGLFPPANLPMGAALAAYEGGRRGPYGWMLGRFLLPAGRLDELLAALPAMREPLPLGVVVDAGSDSRKWTQRAAAALERLAQVRRSEPRVALEALEILLPEPASLRDTFDAPIGQFAMLAQSSGLRELAAYLELPRGPRWADLLEGAAFALARHRLRAKVRCGGLTAQAVPAVADLAAFMRAMAAEGVAFKATAGLHHPVRHWNAASGFAMHGFLNVLAAAAFAGSGEEAASILADEDAAHFGFDETGLRWCERHAGALDVARIRSERFVSYGSCSFEEPLADLLALHLLEP